MDCIFCKIVNNEIKSYKIYEDEKVIAILDAFPSSAGHCLIIPKEHTVDLLSIDDDMLCHISKVSKYLYSKLMEKLPCDSFVCMQNNGFKQEVKHYHYHLIPGYSTEYNKTVEEVYEILTK